MPIPRLAAIPLEPLQTTLLERRISPENLEDVLRVLSPGDVVISPVPTGYDHSALATSTTRARVQASTWSADAPTTPIEGQHRISGVRARSRPDASIYPRHLASKQQQVQDWLRSSILNGYIGAWEGGYPKYVWYRDGQTVCEARQGPPGSGEYHGYPLQPQEVVRGLP